MPLESISEEPNFSKSPKLALETLPEREGSTLPSLRPAFERRKNDAKGDRVSSRISPLKRMMSKKTLTPRKELSGEDSKREEALDDAAKLLQSQDKANEALLNRGLRARSIFDLSHSHVYQSAKSVSDPYHKFAPPPQRDFSVVGDMAVLYGLPSLQPASERQQEPMTARARLQSFQETTSSAISHSASSRKIREEKHTKVHTPIEPPTKPADTPRKPSPKLRRRISKKNKPSETSSRQLVLADRAPVFATAGRALRHSGKPPGDSDTEPEEVEKDRKAVRNLVAEAANTTESLFLMFREQHWGRRRAEREAYYSMYPPSPPKSPPLSCHTPSTSASEEESDWEAELSRLVERGSPMFVEKEEPKADTEQRLRQDFFNLYSQFVGQPGIMRVRRLQTARHAYLEACERLKMLPHPFIIKYAQAKDAAPVLKLGHYGMSDRSAEALAQGLRANSNAEGGVVDLADNVIGKKGCIALANAIADQNTKIKVWDLSYNKFGRVGAEALVDAVSQSQCLVSLLLAGNNIGDRTTALLVRAVSNVMTLTALDLSRNHVGRESAMALATLIPTNTRLTTLILNWNAIKGKGAVALARSLHAQKNPSLRELQLTHNGFGRGGMAALASSLATNQTLTSLSLAYNRINEASSLVLSSSLARNDTLKSVCMDGNYVGHTGGRAFMRLQLARSKEAPLSISLNSCSFSSDTALFDLNEPNGHYTLDLADPYDQSVAQHLTDIARGEVGFPQWKSPTLDGRRLNPSSLHENWVLPSSGILELEFQTPPVPLPCMRPEAFEALEKLLSQELEESSRRSLVLLTALDQRFSMSQAETVINMFKTPHERVEMISALFMRIVDLDEFWAFMNTKVSALERKSITHHLGKLLYFDSRFPTGRYRLDLSKIVDREIAKELIALSKDEVVELRPTDPKSLKRRNAGWRNFTLDGTPFSFSEFWKPPTSGILELDYVSTKRPDPSKAERVLTGEEWTLYVDKFKENGFVVYHATPVINLELMQNMYFTCEEVVELCKFTKSAGQKVDVAQHVWDRVVDLYNYGAVLLAANKNPVRVHLSFGGEPSAMKDHRELQHYLLEVNWARKELTNRLGWLNCWCPMWAEGFYDLDLSILDERRVAELLVQLALKEPGINWTNQFYRGKPFDLPSTWVAFVPDSGRLAFEYSVTPDQICWLDRRDLSEACLPGSQLSLLPGKDWQAPGCQRARKTSDQA